MKSRHIMIVSALSFLACDAPRGLAPTPAGAGPRVRFDLLATPFPDIPLPNDMATRLDPSSPTGRRLNISTDAPTKAESRLRRKANDLDGFGVLSPVMVSFDDPLDVANVRDRHAKNHDLSDDAVLLLDIDRRSPGFGEAVPLDAGQGNYPIALEWPWQYWDFDEHADSVNLLFETHDEDLNHNGKTDPYEDIDFDGVLDRPNTWSGKDPGPMGPDDLISFYERQTDTLILWPVVPMRQATRYAVVLTRHLEGADGAPVRSPFPWVNAADQTPDLAPLAEVLARPGIGMSIDDVAFAWTFTTESVTRDLETIRAGLHGHGQLAALAHEFPPDLAPKVVREKDESGKLPAKPYVLYNDMVGPLFSAVGPLLNYPAPVVEALQEDTGFTDYWVLGSFTTPCFLRDRDGIATKMYPADDNESFDVDVRGASATRGPSTVSFMCSIPKSDGLHKPPFPVVVYGHGFSGAPFEVFGFAGRLARFGYALCGLDAVGHGLALPADEDIPYDELIPQFLGPMGLLTFYDAFRGGRIRDLDNDGQITSWDNGGDFWVWDVFHMRDMVRQTVVDHMQFIRILRSLGTITWPADTNGNGKADDLMGDWDGDGVIDLGGQANQSVPMWGQSMGAIVTQVLTAVEPAIPAAAPISGGGGLIHIGVRSVNPGVPEAVVMPMMGPFVVFTPLGDKDDTVEIAQMINHLHREYPRDRPPGRAHYYPFARTTAIRPGDRVIVRNLANGVEVKAFRHKDGRGFRVSLAADSPGAVEKRPLLGLHDGDTQPVPVTCGPGTWTVKKDTDGKPAGPAGCANPDPRRALLFGDAIEIEVREGWDGPVRVVLNTFDIPVTYEGAFFPGGTPLVAIGTGLGRARNTPDFRKLMVFAAMAVGRGDPVGYASHYRHEEHLDFGYDPIGRKQANVIIFHTVGDPNTNTATSLNLARAAGVLEYQPAKAGAATQNDRLLQAFVSEGVETFRRHISSKLKLKDWAASNKYKDMRWVDEFDEDVAKDPEAPLPLHADPDDFDNGTDEYGETSLSPPVRATLHNDHGYLALRLPYTHPLGAHGVEPSNPTRVFNINNFVENQIGVFFSSGGKVLSDDPCLEDSSCPFLPESLRK